MKRNSTELKVKYHGNKTEKSKGRKKNPNVASVSQLGYRDDSPYRSLPYIDIHTPDGSIDMSGTGIPLWANGRILPPYSGIHRFDTETVREIPLAKTGGPTSWLEKYQTGREFNLNVPNTAVAATTAVNKPLIVPTSVTLPLPEEFFMKDPRKIHPVTGKPINERKDLKKGTYSTDVVQTIAKQAKEHGLSKEDALNLMAISLQESLLGKLDDEVGHALHGDPITGYVDRTKVFEPLSEEEVNQMSPIDLNTRNMIMNYVYNTKMLNIDKGRKPSSRAEFLQWYNTPYPEKGSVGTSTEKQYHNEMGVGTNSFYGIDVTKQPLSMKSNPYGKTVQSLADSVLGLDPTIQEILERTYKKTGGSKLPPHLPMAQTGRTIINSIDQIPTGEYDSRINMYLKNYIGVGEYGKPGFTELTIPEFKKYIQKNSRQPSHYERDSAGHYYAIFKHKPMSLMPSKGIESTYQETHPELITQWDGPTTPATPFVDYENFQPFTAAGYPMIDVRSKKSSVVPKGYIKGSKEEEIYRKRYEKGGPLPKAQDGKSVLTAPGVYQELPEGMTEEEFIDYLKSNNEYFGDITQQDYDKRKADLFNKYYGQIEPYDIDPNTRERAKGFDYYYTEVPDMQQVDDNTRSDLINKMQNFMQYVSGPRATQNQNAFTNTPEEIDRALRFENNKLKVNQDLTPQKPFGYGMSEYRKGGWLDRYQSGGPTVRELWESATGKPWSAAKELGLTTGTYADNKALKKRIMAGEFGKMKASTPAPVTVAPAKVVRPASPLYMQALNQSNKQAGARDASSTLGEQQRRAANILVSEGKVKPTKRDDTKAAPEGSVRSYVQKGVDYLEKMAKLSSAMNTSGTGWATDLGTSLITAPVQSGLNISNTVMGDRPIRNDSDILDLGIDVANVLPFAAEAMPALKSVGKIAGKGLKNFRNVPGFDDIPKVKIPEPRLLKSKVRGVTKNETELAGGLKMVDYGGKRNRSNVVAKVYDPSNPNKYDNYVELKFSPENGTYYMSASMSESKRKAGLAFKHLDDFFSKNAPKGSIFAEPGSVATPGYKLSTRKPTASTDSYYIAAKQFSNKEGFTPFLENKMVFNSSGINNPLNLNQAGAHSAIRFNKSTGMMEAAEWPPLLRYSNEASAAEDAAKTSEFLKSLGFDAKATVKKTGSKNNPSFIIESPNINAIKEFLKGGSLFNNKSVDVMKNWLDKYQGNQKKSQTGAPKPLIIGTDQYRSILKPAPERDWRSTASDIYEAVLDPFTYSGAALDYASDWVKQKMGMKPEGELDPIRTRAMRQQAKGTATNVPAQVWQAYNKPLWFGNLVDQSVMYGKTGDINEFQPALEGIGFGLGARAAGLKLKQMGGGSDDESFGPVRKAGMASVEAGEGMPEVTRTQETESFGEAFKKARAAGLKTFTWRGKTFGTKYKTEVEDEKKPAPKQPLAQKSSVPPRPMIDMSLRNIPVSSKPKTVAQPSVQVPIAKRTAPVAKPAPTYASTPYSVAVTDPYASRITEGVMPTNVPMGRMPAGNISYGYQTAPASTTAVAGPVIGAGMQPVGRASKTLPTKSAKPVSAKLQNQQPENVAADVRDFQNNLMGSMLSKLNQRSNVPMAPGRFQIGSDPRQLPQTGVIVDKRTGEAYVKTPSSIYNYPVLTAKNPDLNANPYSVEYLENHPELRNTPRGYYTLEDLKYFEDTGMYHPTTTDDKAGGFSRWLNAISAFGMPAPVASATAFHGTYLGDFANRNPRYTQSPEQRWVSYGCVNARECDIKRTFNDIAVGDTSVVLDSKFPEDAILLEQIKREQMQRQPLVSQTVRRKKGGSAKDWLKNYQ